jgi:hypothetical protein
MPFVYNINGKKYPVGPCIRKLLQIKSLPSIYPYLKNDRPPHVTMCAVVMDAMARLPQSIGTRVDVA